MLLLHQVKIGLDWIWPLYIWTDFQQKIRKES